MSLATQEQIDSLFRDINNNNSLFQEHKIVHTPISITRTEYRYRNNRLFQRSDGVNLWPFSFEISNIAKVTSLTEKTRLDLQRDLFYHWATDFIHLSTAAQLREAITNPATGASFATTIAVNRFIQQTNPTDNGIKNLFTGSKWRWIKMTSGDWVQQTLYGAEYTWSGEKTLLFMAAVGMPNNWRNHSCTSLIPFNTWLTKEITKINTLIRNTPRELLGYSTRATSHFAFKPSPKKLFHTFLGVELELEGHSAAEWKTLDILQQHAIFKRDGSLREGVEICTTPATLDVHKEEFEKFFAGVKTNKSKLKDMTNCGMHVHIDKAKLSTLHIANIYQFINNKENRSHINTIAGRDPNNYCQEHLTDYSHFTNRESNDRYRMVNLNPADTIEIRIFASTINYKDFCKRLEFVQAVVDYTRPGEVNIPVSKIPQWNNFQEYLKPHRKVYPTLVASLYGEKPVYVP